jgi:hypothetical protein
MGYRTVESIVERGCSRSRDTRGPVRLKSRDHDHDSDTATPRPGVTVWRMAAPSSAFDLCGCIQRALLATRPDTVCKARSSFADVLFTQGVMALMQPIICCVRAQSAREFVTEFSGGATPHRSGVAQS